MIRAATPKAILDIVGWLLVSLLIGALAGRESRKLHSGRADGARGLLRRLRRTHR